METQTYYERNREKCIAYAKAYNASHKEQMKEYWKAYYQTNKAALNEQRKTYQSTYRSRHPKAYVSKAKGLPMGRPRKPRVEVEMPLSVVHEPLPPPPPPQAPPIVVEERSVWVRFD